MLTSRGLFFPLYFTMAMSLLSVCCQSTRLDVLIAGAPALAALVLRTFFAEHFKAILAQPPPCSINYRTRRRLQMPPAWAVCLVVLCVLVPSANAEPITIGAVVGAIFTAMSVVASLVQFAVAVIQMVMCWGLFTAIVVYVLINIYHVFGRITHFNFTQWLIRRIYATLNCEAITPETLNYQTEPVSTAA
jgi:hypothetical protein